MQGRRSGVSSALAHIRPLQPTGARNAIPQPTSATKTRKVGRSHRNLSGPALPIPLKNRPLWMRTSSRRQKLLYPRKRRYTGQPLRGYRSPKTARDPRYRPLKTIKIRGNERLSGQPLFDLGRQTAKGFAEPVEAFAVEGGEIREVDY